MSFSPSSILLLLHSIISRGTHTILSMHSPKQELENPLKRGFSDMSSDAAGTAALDDQDHHRKEPPLSSCTNPREFIPKGYEMRIYEVAMKKNLIAVLDTADGNTMVAVMLIKDIGQAVKTSGTKKLIVFLAPTVNLVKQQFEHIKTHTDLEVEHYYGAKGVDGWTLDCWEGEINEHDVLVMTPQVLLDALRKAFLDLEMVSLIIIDECHRATGKHPYAKIMKDFYRRCSKKPKIFGMTTSPVVRKGISSNMDCEGQISELETILDSRIYTIEDRKEMESYFPSAKEYCCRFYDPIQFCSLDLKARIKASWLKFDASFLELQESLQTCYKDMVDKLKAMQMRFSNDHANILHCLDNLGLICAYEAVKVCLENMQVMKECETYKQSWLRCKNFLEDLLHIIGENLAPFADEVFMDSRVYFSKAVHLGYISPKLHELLQFLQSFGGTGEVECLVLVDRIVTAKMIERFLKRVTHLSQFMVSYLTGSNTSVDAPEPKGQKETLELFHSGKVNLLFSTDAVEERVHVSNCSHVIQFDLPTTVQSYIQSRGRAQQNGSLFVIMLERGNIEQRDQLFELIKSEYSMMKAATNRDRGTFLPKACTFVEKDEYIVHATGASVSADSSICLIHQYCKKLPGDKYYTPKPSFEFLYSGGLFQCKLSLPADAAFETIVGPLRKSSFVAKQLVCLEACQKLHQLGALDDHLIPSIKKFSENDHDTRSKESGAGTTKRKELHGTTCIRALSGSWGGSFNGAVFQVYKIDFSCNIIGEVYSGFVLLIESKLDDDVGNLEVELYLLRKRVKSFVSSCAEVHLDAEEMMKAKRFQEFFFNGLFGRLFIGSKSTATQREFFLQNETTAFWSSSNMYLLLPIEITLSHQWRINWSAVNACSSVVEYLSRNPFFRPEQYGGEKGYLTPSRNSSSETECKMENTVHFVNGSVDASSLKQMVVLAVHTGRIYSIIEVLSDTSAESSFDGNSNALPVKYATFAEYFNKKYGIVLRYPGQPMLLLKQTHNPYNLLVNFHDEGISARASKAGLVNEKPRNHIRMPPELLFKIDVPIYVLKSFYLLPSLMHRMESLMLASQLREEIACHSTNFNISSSLILEAITTLGCCESFSMERLELLGDSVLKYAVSCQLFLKHPEKHEGKLTSQRQWAICNSNLHKLGTDRKLQGYIRACAFDPRRWVAPGQLSIRDVPCNCGVDTQEVPLDNKKFQTEDLSIVVGKSCDRGHRWMNSKTISDCVEALIGAYYVAGGLTPAIHMMKWLGIDVELDPALVNEAINRASLLSYVPKTDDVSMLESKLGYKFSVKLLLREAITHTSVNDSFNYERLEFLGDAVLDLLITWHLYQHHTDIDPGEMTDLRSASVNNENFAQVCVRHMLHEHLQHCSPSLLQEITEYIKSFPEPDDTTKSGPERKGPKALGDLVESIAGAMLIDSKLNLDEVWRIFKPLLSPIVTPDKLELPPLRELIELCDSLGYFIQEKCTIKGEMVNAELRLQLEDVLLVREGHDRSRKEARGKAASYLLKDLEKRGISGCLTKRKRDTENCADLKQTANNDSSQLLIKKQKKTEPARSIKASSLNLAAPVITINMKKGGPRTTLFELCKKALWPMPTFDTTENKSRTPIELGEGAERRKCFNSFVSEITLHIPGFSIIKCEGEARADKKSSYDSAALVLFYELEKQGHVVINDPNKSIV